LAKLKTLQPIRDNRQNEINFEKLLKKLFKELVFDGLIRDIRSSKLKVRNDLNSIISSELLKRLSDGRIKYVKNVLTGQFNSKITKELRDLGAVWDKSRRGFILSQSKLPASMTINISSFEAKKAMDAQIVSSNLNNINLDEALENIDFIDQYDDITGDFDKKFDKTVNDRLKINVNLMPEEKAILATELSNNLKLTIKSFMEDEILNPFILYTSILASSINS